MDPDEILNFWFPNTMYQKWWFIGSQQLDQEITDKYYGQIQSLFSNFHIDEYKTVPINKIISDIILLDQFSRNISRVIKDIDVNAYTEKAELLSNIWIERQYYLTEPIAHTVFAFLPIRHSKNKIKIRKLLPVLDEIKNFNNNESNPIYNKFYTHTLKAIQ